MEESRGLVIRGVKVVVGIWGQGSSRKPGDELRPCLAVWGPEAGCKEGIRGEGPGGLPALGTLLLHAVGGVVPAWVGSMGTGSCSPTRSGEESVGSGCPCQEEAAGHPVILAVGSKGRGDRGAWPGQLRDRVSGAGKVPCALEVARPLGVKPGTRGGGRYRFGSVLTAVGREDVAREGGSREAPEAR